MNLKRVPITFWFALGGAIIACLFNYLIFQDIMIRDLRVYENPNTQPGDVFRLFYTMSSNTPKPTIINLLATVIIGAVMGLILSPYEITIESSENENRKS